MGEWYEAQVINTNGDYVLVQYNGWNERWNQWINSTSTRIMPFRTQTVQNTHSLYMSPSPQDQRPLQKTTNPNFQTNLTDFMQQLSVTIDRLNYLLKECQQNSEMNFYFVKDRTDSEFPQNDTKFQKQEKEDSRKEEKETEKEREREREEKEYKFSDENNRELVESVENPSKEPMQCLNDNLSNKCEDNISNKCDNDDISNKSFKSKRSEGLVDTSSMKSLKIDDKPNVFFDLEAKSVRSMKSQMPKQTHYLNRNLYQENIKEEEASELQEQDSYQEARRHMKKQSFKELICRKESERLMKASQLAPLLDRMGRIMIDLAPHVALIGNTDQLANYQNLSTVTNEGSLQSRIVSYLRGQQSAQEPSENNYIQGQYCDFQVPIMLTPIEIYAMNEIQAQQGPSPFDS